MDDYEIQEKIENILNEHIEYIEYEGANVDKGGIIADFFNLLNEFRKYKTGFEELICYFDSISDEQQPKISKRLEELGL